MPDQPIPVMQAVGSPVRFEQTPLGAIAGPDMHAMWWFLNGPGFQVDLAGRHSEFPDVGWTSFANRAARTFETAT